MYFFELNTPNVLHRFRSDYQNLDLPDSDGLDLQQQVMPGSIGRRLRKPKQRYVLQYMYLGSSDCASASNTSGFLIVLLFNINFYVIGCALVDHWSIWFFAFGYLVKQQRITIHALTVLSDMLPFFHSDLDLLTRMSPQLVKVLGMLSSRS